MAENKQYDRVKEITDQLEAGIADLFNSDSYKTWLNTMSRFHDYSLNNTLLIAMQKPEATLVAGYSTWQKQFGRQVNKGEKAIRILAPTPYKQKVEVDKTDPNTGEILMNPDGSHQKEIQEVLRPAFKVVNVFDVSQTEGRELPSLGVNELTGDVEQFESFFEALKRSCPVPMEFEKIPGGAKGYYHQIEQRIAILEGMSQVQTVKTAIHEMAHQKLHAIDPEKKTPAVEGESLSRNGKEVEAESVAYTVCQHFGIDTSDYSFAYIAGWSQGKETPELKASLNTIRKAASEMIHDVDGNMRELLQEKEAEQKKEAAYQIGDGYLEIHEASDGSWDYTIYSADFREIDGGQIGEPGSMNLDQAANEILAFYHMMPQDMTEMDREQLGEMVALYNPALSKEQIQFVSEVIKQGFDPKHYWSGGRVMDLTAEAFSAEQLEEFRYQAKVDAIPKMMFSAEQWHVIESGISEKLDVEAYADPSISPEKMKLIHDSLKRATQPLEKTVVSKDKKEPMEEKKSVLADLRKKQAQVSGTGAPQGQSKSKSKEME